MNVSERTMPHSIEVERAVLGAALLHPDAFQGAAEVLTPEHFFRDAHRRIFAVMVDLTTQGSGLDLVTVKEALAKGGHLEAVGGPSYLAALIDGVPRSSNVDHYARIVKDKATLRNIIFASNKALASAYEAEDDPSAVINDVMSDFLTVAQSATGPGFRPVGAGISQTLDTFEELSKPDSQAWGHRTGLTALDRYLRGLRPSKFLVIAARPGVGKTSLALNIAATVAATNHAVGFFSLEMSYDELLVQLSCSEARVNLEDLTDGKLERDDWARVSETMGRLKDLPLFIDDSTELSPIDLRAKCRRLQKEHGLALVVIDYIQLMHGGSSYDRRKAENRTQEMGAISRALKRLSKDLHVPVIGLSQLSRATEARIDRRPELADLRDSGSIEQDADVVVMIYRADMYPVKKTRLPKRTAQIVDEVVQKGVTELLIRKHRGGKTGVARVLFREEYTRFDNLQM